MIPRDCALGTIEAEGQHNLKVGQLLNDAIRKNSPHTLVVFLDLNLPWNTADRLLGTGPPRPPHPIIQNTLDRMRKRQDGKDPINLLVVTNHPEHYSAEEEAAPSPQILSVESQIPLHPAARPDALLSIHQAANLYGRIPQFFPGSERQPSPASQKIHEGDLLPLSNDEKKHNREPGRNLELKKHHHGSFVLKDTASTIRPLIPGALK